MKLLVSIVFVCMLSACSTVSGLGKDITSASDWTKEKISKPTVDLNKGN
jgi:predicted small secreted protein